MVDRRRKLHKELIAAPPPEYGPWSGVAIPNSSAVERMGIERAPVATYARSSAVSWAYRGLWQVVSDALALERSGL